MDNFVDFISSMIYGSGSEAEITPNHNDWVSANSSPSGVYWFTHHVDRMLPAFEAWQATHNLPPIIPWNGVRPEPWDTNSDIPLGADLDGSFTGIASLEDLGTALRDRYNDVSSEADEISGITKAPFSYRYWGYMKWAQQMRDRYNGAVILPPTYIYDRDGTPLSAIPFTDVFNELHWRWHLDPPATSETPGFDTTAGQRAGAGGVGMGGGEEFILFHRDHVELYSRWLARSGQQAVRGINLYNNGTGWPGSNMGNPSTWSEADDDQWINSENGDTDNNLLTGTSNVNDLGSDMNFGIHGSGHILNTDIASLVHNNYVPRFHAWHGWIDNQLWWREPRFARWNTTTGLRERIFEPVLGSGTDWPGLPAVTIVRDPLVATDDVSPSGAIASLDFTSGSGTLRMRFLVQDSYNRSIQLRLRADVFDDETSTSVPVETLPEASNTYVVGDTASGDDFDLGSEFEVDFTFASAFVSDDPARVNPAVGFTNNRIRISGTLGVADGSDPGFIHRDYCDLSLVQEKVAPEIDLYFDLSSFGQDQIDSAMSATEARFNGALIVIVQDRTSDPAPPVWPAETADEVKGLIRGFVPASGLFSDSAHAPVVEILDATTDLPVTGLHAELLSGPDLEDTGLADNQMQRFTYRYDIVFDTGHEAFDGLGVGDVRFADIVVSTADRSGNATSETGQIKLFNEANPFMRDGSPSWLSIDTRVFRLFEGESSFGATLNPGQPNAFIQQVIQNLNAGTTGGDTFNGLATNKSESALEYSTSISNPSTGGSQNVFNFSLAKVRLQGPSGAADVRAFFRLFRYTSSNLVFDATTGYRTHDDGSGRKVPLLGYAGASGGNPVISIPFFAEQRLAYADAMTDQTDPANVQTFVPGPSDERVLYFGVYLDINQTASRLPASYIEAHPDGGFGVGEVQSIRSLMTDAHQCMVVEIAYAGDATVIGDTPASSDNLAQRNLAILYTDNPGERLTHTVQHSFEVNTGRRLPQHLPDLKVQGLSEFILGEDKDDEHYQDDNRALANPPQIPMRFISSGHLSRKVRMTAFDIAMLKARNMKEMMHPDRFMDDATRFVDQRFPLVFDAADWRSTKHYFDELLILWNGLPRKSRVEIYLPSINCEQIINLRNLRHSPNDVRLIDSHTLLLVPGGVTYLPIPNTRDGQVPGMMTIELPEGIKKGQAWKVDVLQLRGGEHRTTGAFRLDIQVNEAKDIVDAEIRLLDIMFERLSLLSRQDRWYPVMAKRVEMIRKRAAALATSAGNQWKDPTVWTDPGDPTKQEQPLEGTKIRVVLEKIQILEDRDPWIKGAGEIRFLARVFTANNGGVLQETPFPDKGVYTISDTPGKNVLEINHQIFEGYVKDDLQIEVTGTELDTFDPDDTVGKYTRIFCGSSGKWFGAYAPGAGVIDPQDMLAWKIWYRIEKP